MTSKTVTLSRENSRNRTGRRTALRGNTQESYEFENRDLHNPQGQYFEHSMDLWWRMGTDGYITFANRGLQNTLGFSSDEFLSMAFLEFIHPEDQASTIDIFLRLTEEDQFISHVCRFLCQDRTYRRIHWQATYSAPEGFITAIGRSIDSIQNEDQREIFQEANIVSVPQFILRQEKTLNLIHDLNNILSAMLGYTQLASLKLSNEHAVQELLQKASAVGHRAQELVEKSLESQGQDNQKYKPVELSKVVEETILILRATLPDTVTIQQGEICGFGVIYGDFTKIFQLVMNLCSNAVKVMNSTGGTLSIWIDTDGPVDPIGTSHGSDSYAHLSIGDTGPGMTSDTLQRIFEPYFTTHPDDKGTGLGLAIVNEIITDHGGFIKVESELGKGSIFHVYFPSQNSNEKMTV